MTRLNIEKLPSGKLRVAIVSGNAKPITFEVDPAQIETLLRLAAQTEKFNFSLSL